MEIAGYAGLELLGRGGFSSVYRAHQAAQSRDVALKVLTVDVSDAAAKARFERECAANGRLGSHPNVMTVFESGYTSDGKPYISMELCAAGSLADQLAGRTFTVEEVLRIGIKIAGAVETAHRNGITHRDIKPENILTTSFGEYVLADFGISALDSVRSGTATAGSFTLSHVPPEVLQGEVSGVPGDIYSLGSTLYRLLTGRPPFADETTPLAVAITRTLNDPLPDPGANVPASLTRALEASMAKDPARRPASAVEFATMLQQVQRETGQAVTEPVVAAIAAAAPAAGPAPADQSAPVAPASQPASTPATETVRPAPAPAPATQTVRPASTPAPAEPAPVAADHGDGSSEPVTPNKSSGGPSTPGAGGRSSKALVGALVALAVIGGGAFVVLGGGGGGDKAAVEAADTTQPAADASVPDSGATSTTAAESTVTTAANGKTSGAGTKSTVPKTTVPKTKSTTPATAAPQPVATAAPVTAAPSAGATTTTVKVPTIVTFPKLTFGCSTRSTCAQALVDAWVKNDVTAAKAATTGTSDYQAVTKLFEYPYKTYGAGFSTTVTKLSDQLYQITSSRSALPYKFAFMFEADASSVKVALTVPITTK